MPERQAMPAARRIALIAHDNKKQDILERAEFLVAVVTVSNRGVLLGMLDRDT